METYSEKNQDIFYISSLFIVSYININILKSSYIEYGVEKSPFLG
jgi:hypothetical protein